METKPNASNSDYNIPSSWDGALNTRPSSDKITLGWEENEKPPANYFNWFWNFVFSWFNYFDDAIDEIRGGQRRLITQELHGFSNDFIYYDNDTSLWTKAIATSISSLATHFAVRIDNNNFYAYNIGEISTTGILDEAGSALTKETYYYLSDSVAGKCTSIRPTINEEQICFKVGNTYLTLFPSYCPGLFTKFATFGGYKTYSINSGNVDSNGYADIVTKVSNTEVSFKVGGTYDNLEITFPNGNHYTISSIANISGLSLDNTYVFVIYEENLIDEDDGTYSTTATPITNTITEDKNEPISSVDGDLLLLFNKSPMISYIKKSSEWTEKQFIKIGEATKSAGTLETPVTYAFNRKTEIIITGSLGNQLAQVNHCLGTDNIICEKIQYIDITNNRNVEIGLSNHYDDTSRGLRLVDTNKTVTYLSKDNGAGASWVFFYIRNGSQVQSTSGNFKIILKGGF